MKTAINTSDFHITFSHWCGKGYAVFAALGREVRIAGLALHICACALRKSGRKGLIITRAACPDEMDVLTVRKRVCVCGQFVMPMGKICPDAFHTS